MMTENKNGFKFCMCKSLFFCFLVVNTIGNAGAAPIAQASAKDANQPATEATPTTAPTGKPNEAKPASAAEAAPQPQPAKQAPSEAKNMIIDTPKDASSAVKTPDVNVAISKRIEIANHGTKVINLKQPAGQVLLTDPKVADVQLVTPSTLYIYGRSPGNTEIIVTGQDMQTAYRYAITVISDYRELETLIRGFAPNSNIKVHSVPDGLLLQGRIDRSV